MEILRRTKKEDDQSVLTGLTEAEVSRRKFLRFSGFAGVSAVLLGGSALTGCKKDNDDNDGVNLGSGDFGVLNYAYALEQLEAAFYTQVVTHSSFTTTFNALEQEYIRDVRDHEVAHREFLKAALKTNAIQNLEVDFSSVDFGSRTSVLNASRAFEDLGVAAYNGAGKLLTSPDFLTIAGKIVSVEARHAALFRDLISNGSFANLNDLAPLGAVDRDGLDVALEPAQVLSIAAPFIKTKINISNLPTS
jgi:hypothetical protein